MAREWGGVTIHDKLVDFWSSHLHRIRLQYRGRRRYRDIVAGRDVNVPWRLQSYSGHLWFTSHTDVSEYSHQSCLVAEPWKCGDYCDPTRRLTRKLKMYTHITICYFNITWICTNLCCLFYFEKGMYGVCECKNVILYKQIVFTYICLLKSHHCMLLNTLEHAWMKPQSIKFINWFQVCWSTAQ